ncbi:colorectal mutant cancer protein isoform X2 [Eurosta solidaginis]|uniref:colorectal mutant cancer protein isoform X2 n=1 Tax=Eurosta solidaginis TaxID=178769 RepID=UPI00353153BD
MIMEYWLPLTRSLSCMCCSEMQQRRQQQPFNENLLPPEWDFTMISQPLTIPQFNVENLSLQQLEVQVRDLIQRLQSSEQQRMELQHKLEECSGEKELCLRRLEVISAAHECRITEMHCVIAELSKKLRAKQENVILEENEPEESELSYQEDVSVYNSELNLTNPDAECQTDLVESGAEQSVCEGQSNSDNLHCVDLTEQQRMNDVVGKGQVEALQEEVLHLKAQIALLQSEIANSQIPARELKHIKEDMSSNLYEKMKNGSDSDGMAQSDFVTPLKPYELLSTPQVHPPVPKIAERVKLKCGIKSMHSNHVSKTTTDILNNENDTIIDQLITDSKQYEKSMTESFAEVSKIDTEMQRLQRKIEHLKMRNTMLSLTLDECKEHCEHLYLLCGKYESNAIALQTAVNCSDRAIEAYDVMLALLESKLALMTEKTLSAEESRRAVETVARHLLDRLESEKNICENSLGPWQSTFSISDKLCSPPWTSEDDNRLRNHVSKLKGHRSTVQNTIVNLESPFSDLYEKSRLAIESGKEMVQKESSIQLDIEMAVMMQELLNLREENINLKSKVESAEIEKRLSAERNSSLEEALQQLQLQLQLQLEISTDTSSVLFHREKIAENRISYSESEHVALTEQQLVEALTRESELKCRIQTLIASVTASQLNADERHVQLQNNIQELQKSNLNLTQLLEQNKRRYQARVRRLEQKIMEMSFGLDQKYVGAKLNLTDDTITNENITKSSNDYVDVAPSPQCLKSKISEELPQSYESQQLQIQEIVPETTL